METGRRVTGRQGDRETGDRGTHGYRETGRERQRQRDKDTGRWKTEIQGDREKGRQETSRDIGDRQGDVRQ